MRSFVTRAQRGAGAVLARVDAALDRLYGSRFNPLYQSGALVVLCMVVLTATGLYLTLFYRVGAPYDSVQRVTEQAWAGRWIRALHRYASDAAVAAAALHAFRLFVQDRFWGPRALAWVSGLVLLFAVLVCGWTGYVMVWDVQAQVLAVEGARILDALPIFSEPIGRAFGGERALPGAFFFLNLFAHIGLPIGLGLLLWLHVSRLARPKLLPPRGLAWAAVGLLTAVSIAWPVGMAPPADLLRVPEGAPYDLFYAFWLPISLRLSAGAVWAVGIAIAIGVVLVPVLARPPRERRPAPSVTDEERCTACLQCHIDCPYEAIAMVERPGSLKGIVARVTPELCVSCGICAGSCAPMLVGPPGRNGRQQVADVRNWTAEWGGAAPEVAIVSCARAADPGVPAGTVVHRVPCAGSVHTSVVELLLRAGAGGVLLVACPIRDCREREGPQWLSERLYHDREAELQARVDRRRVRLAHLGAGRGREARAELDRFLGEIAALRRAADAEPDLVRLCRTVEEEVAR
jgi:coenzyme F420-reducing hydrogenase delta subunit/Pyruvate/2-oxoacid:ferredoxin oxidoreductase delta subunit